MGSQSSIIQCTRYCGDKRNVSGQPQNTVYCNAVPIKPGVTANDGEGDPLASDTIDFDRKLYIVYSKNYSEVEKV